MNLNDLFGLFIGNVYLILRLMTKISFRDKRYKKKYKMESRVWCA